MAIELCKMLEDGNSVVTSRHSVIFQNTWIFTFQPINQAENTYALMESILGGSEWQGSWRNSLNRKIVMAVFGITFRQARNL
jgi:hypothetical protein